MTIARTARLSTTAVLTWSLSGCAAAGQPALPYMRSDVAIRELAGTGAGKITHVVYILQENRSFDNLFQGYPGADTVASGKDLRGKTIALAAGASLASSYIDHSAESMFAACDGTGKLPGTGCRMDGFDNEQSTSAAPKNPAIRLRSAPGVEAVLRHGAEWVSWRIACFPRSSI